MASERLQRQIDRLLDEAELAIAQRDWASVRERALDVVAIDPENQERQDFLAAANSALEGSPSPPSDPPIASNSATPSAVTPHSPSSFSNGPSSLIRFND